MHFAVLHRKFSDLKLTSQTKGSSVNIGFPLTKTPLKDSQIRAVIRKNKTELQALVEDGKLSIDLDKVDDASWETNKKEHLRRLGEHFGVFRDLFGGAYFYPHIDLDISYDISEEEELPVYHGNLIEPSQTARVPSVQYEADSQSLWTLLMTAPDSHLQDNNAEYLHWLVGNIPGNDINKGELLCDYLQVFPVKGTGFHRYVFILFKQERKIDFKEDRLAPDSVSLRERTFSTFDFYKKHQDHMTPAGFCLFQSEHDESVRDVFWNKLGMKEPSFEFVFPVPYHPRQRKFPHRQPFNLYLDRYRDIKDIDEEVLREKLKTVHPFRQQEEIKYPMYQLKQEYKGNPMWLKVKKKNAVRKLMHWEDS
ncbi:large ribosomal subunit protein mL38-like isoform X2 [Crassostrea virginica]